MNQTGGIAIEIDQVKLAFELRQPDAMERAERLRDRLVVEASRFMQVADLQQKSIEAGADTRLRYDDGEIVERQDLISAAATNIARANDLAGMASNVSDLIEAHAGKNLREDGEGPTTEMLYQIARGRKGDPVLRLHAMNRLSDDEVRAAREIESVIRFVTTGLGMKVQRLPVKAPVGAGDVNTPPSDPARRDHYLGVVHGSVYVPWTLRCRKDVALVLGLAVEGQSIRVLARRHGMRWKEAATRAARALNTYARMRRKARSEIDQEDQK